MSSPDPTRSIPLSYTSWRPAVAFTAILFIANLPINPGIKCSLMVASAMAGLSHSLGIRGQLLLLALMFETVRDSMAYLVFLVTDSVELNTESARELLRVVVEKLDLKFYGFILFVVIGAVFEASVSLLFPFSLLLVYHVEKALVLYRGYGKTISWTLTFAALVTTCFLMVMGPLLDIPIDRAFKIANIITLQPLRLIHLAVYKNNHVSTVTFDSTLSDCLFYDKLGWFLFERDLAIHPIGDREIEFIDHSTMPREDIEVGYRLRYHGPLTLAKPDDQNCFASEDLKYKMPEILRDSELRLGIYVPYTKSQLIIPWNLN